MYNAGDIIKHNAREALSVAPDVPVLEALRFMATHNIGAVLVIEHDQLVGIFSERDYARKVVLQNRSSATTRVRDVMVSQLITVEASATLADCMQLMTDHNIRHLPVFEAQSLMGVISVRDVVRHLIEEQRHLIMQLEAYIHS
ncbi:MAG: CBS domain-containing protein [Steroidobacteraceae bacterium]|jgi:CBS domain-containing protein|nr:CBS domain-containing protein [Gammaproteobacteria bacterium]